MQIARRNLWLLSEFSALFVLIPCYFYFHATRWNIHAALWIVTAYVLFWMKRTPDFSWPELWHGSGWAKRARNIALLRFLFSTLLIIGLTILLVPERLFSFPLQRPILWLAVMLLYPILSALPQEILFRSYFFRRYGNLFPQPWPMIAASAISFGFAHIVFHNWVSPLLCLIGGIMFAYSYTQHRSLKWAAIEHAAYGCMVFTIGIGVYFLVNGWKPS